MAKKLTGTERAALALMVDAALDMTRLKGKMRRAVELVLVDKMRPYLAAREVGADRRHVHRALLVARPQLAKVKRYVRERAAAQR